MSAINYFLKRMNGMKNVFKRFAGMVIGALVAIQFIGCVSSDEYYEDVGLSREAAFRQWKNRKERQEKSQPLISGKLNSFCQFS